MNPDLSKGPVSVILNVHNEADTIEREILEIHRQILSKLPGSELIVAEDGSTDGTKEIIAKYVWLLGVVHVTASHRKGYARAMRDAMAMAKNPYLFFSDSGGKFNFDDFWKLYEVCHRYALVIGVRAKRTDQLYRRLLTSLYNVVLRRYFHVDVHDADSGFRIYCKPLVDKLCREEWINQYLIGSELTLKTIFSGGPIGYVEVAYRGRKDRSRALPMKQIVLASLSVLKNLPKLKKTVSSEFYPKLFSEML